MSAKITGIGCPRLWPQPWTTGTTDHVPGAPKQAMIAATVT
jgi:hypothetical protein